MLDRDLEQDCEDQSIGEMLMDDENVTEAFREKILIPIVNEWIEDGMTDGEQLRKLEQLIFDEYFEAFAYGYWEERMIERAETLAL